MIDGWVIVFILVRLMWLIWILGLFENWWGDIFIMFNDVLGRRRFEERIGKEGEKWWSEVVREEGDDYDCDGRLCCWVGVGVEIWCWDGEDVGCNNLMIGW